MSESLWSIHNRAEEVRIDGLHAFQVKSMLKSFSSAGFANWLIWQEGWVDWQELDSVVDSLFPGVRSATNEKPRLSSVPEMQPNTGVIAEQSPLTYAQQDLKLETQIRGTNEKRRNPQVPKVANQELVSTEAAPVKQMERRANHRFQVPIKLFLHIDGSVIKNETFDVSLSGMKLKFPVTKEPKAAFDVTMLYKGTELALRCRLLTEANGAPRLRLFIEKCNRIEILRTWILEPKKESA